MNGLCRDLMGELLSSEEASRLDYEPVGNERNGGHHAKEFVTFFGPQPPIFRTYFWNAETKTGHYPFDERLGIVGRYTPAVCAEAIAFSKDGDAGGKEDRDAPAEIVYVMADGTGVALRKKHTSKTKGKKGRKGKSKTREVKMAVFFRGGIDSENNPFRMAESTTYVSTTDRREKFEKLARAEFDRRFGRMPKLTIYIGDGGKWVHSVHENEFPFAVEILDIWHAKEHLKPLMLGLGIKEGSKRWKQLHKYWSDRISDGKIESVLDSLWKGKYGKLVGDAMKEYKYFRRNKDRMKYDVYRKNDWFYGSGAMESGCKSVVGQRFKLSGMIWSLNGTKNLLALRTLYKSNRLDEFFNHLVAGLPQVACAA